MNNHNYYRKSNSYLGQISHQIQSIPSRSPTHIFRGFTQSQQDSPVHLRTSVSPKMIIHTQINQQQPIDQRLQNNFQNGSCFSCVICGSLFSQDGIQEHLRKCQAGIQQKPLNNRQVLEPQIFQEGHYQQQNLVRPRTLMCYICKKENIIGSLKQHINQCNMNKILDEKSQVQVQNISLIFPWKQEASQHELDTLNSMREFANQTVRSQEDYQQTFVNEFKLNSKEEAFSNFQNTLQKCEKCERKFAPDRIQIHQDVCIGKKLESQFIKDTFKLQQNKINKSDIIDPPVKIDIKCYGCLKPISIQNFQKHVIKCSECKDKVFPFILNDVLKNPHRHLVDFYNFSLQSQSSNKQQKVEATKKNDSQKNRLTKQIRSITIENQPRQNLHSQINYNSILKTENDIKIVQQSSIYGQTPKKTPHKYKQIVIEKKSSIKYSLARDDDITTPRPLLSDKQKQSLKDIAQGKNNLLQKQNHPYIKKSTDSQSQSQDNPFLINISCLADRRKQHQQQKVDSLLRSNENKSTQQNVSRKLW